MFKNWSISSKIIFPIGVLAILLSTILNTTNLGAMSILGVVGAIFGFLSVVLIVNKNRYAGYAGALSALVYTVVSWVSGNFSDSILNVLFLIFLNLPLIFNKNYTENKEPKSLKGNKFMIESLIANGDVVFFGLYVFETAVMHAPRPEWSVTAATLGIVASVATSIFVVKESFWIWTIQNLMQISLWLITYNQTHSGLAFTMLVTYIMYTINASTSFFNGKWYVKTP